MLISEIHHQPWTLIWLKRYRRVYRVFPVLFPYKVVTLIL